IQKSASQDLGLDLNKPDYKAYVRHVVNKFLQEAAEEEDEKDEAEEEAGVKDNKLEGWIEFQFQEEGDCSEPQGEEIGIDKSSP
ncbi:hypothetical protein LINPERHAP2_LOCUS24121, partial [Linum perenne]